MNVAMDNHWRENWCHHPLPRLHIGHWIKTESACILSLILNDNLTANALRGMVRSNKSTLSRIGILTQIVNVHLIPAVMASKALVILMAAS